MYFSIFVLKRLKRRGRVLHARASIQGARDTLQDTLPYRTQQTRVTPEISPLHTTRKGKCKAKREKGKRKGNNKCGMWTSSMQRRDRSSGSPKASGQVQLPSSRERLVLHLHFCFCFLFPFSSSSSSTSIPIQNSNTNTNTSTSLSCISTCTAPIALLYSFFPTTLIFWYFPSIPQPLLTPTQSQFNLYAPRSLRDTLPPGDVVSSTTSISEEHYLQHETLEAVSCSQMI